MCIIALITSNIPNTGLAFITEKIKNHNLTEEKKVKERTLTFGRSSGLEADVRRSSKLREEQSDPKTRPPKKTKNENVGKEVNLNPCKLTQSRKMGRPDTRSEPLLRVELEFCHRSHTSAPHQSQARFSSLTPRDIGNLLLWSLPSAIPMIEAPREFFIRNKSKLRDVLMVYVNGWSYDMMMCTEAGLPRASSSELEGGMLSERHQHAGDAFSKELNQKNDRGGRGIWNKRICDSLLKPIRTGTCWARTQPGQDNSGGVQYAPVAVSSTKNNLEVELFWRNDAPRVPKESFGTKAISTDRSPISPDNFSKEAKLVARDHIYDSCSDTPDRFCAVVGNDHLDKSVNLGSGVGSAFRRAQALISRNTPSSGLLADKSKSPSNCLEVDTLINCINTKSLGDGDVEKKSHPGVAGKAVTERSFTTPSLWDNREQLVKLALHFPEHKPALSELGFTLEKPLTAIGFGTKSCDASESSAKGHLISQDEDGWECFSISDEETDQQQRWKPKNDVQSEKRPKVFALDCEMVMTKGQVSSLARATLVNARTATVVFDMLVKPRTEIIDYLTRFSGITEETLRGVTNTLKDCQAALKMHIRGRDFVVGHSLENDFRACQMIPNCYVLDTAWLFPHPSGLPYKNSLRFLAMRYLNKPIQQGSHDSAMDAQISAELVHLKLERGPMFGVKERVNVLELICGGSPSSHEPHRSRKRTCSPEDIPVHIRLFGDPGVLSTILPRKTESFTRVASIDAVPVRGDEDAVRKVVRALHMRTQAMHCSQKNVNHDSYSLMWVQLRETAVNLFAQPPSGRCTTTHDEAEQLQRVELVNERVMRMIEACPDETLVLVVAADCKGEFGGNHFSCAHGACFGFIKDHTAAGPSAPGQVPETGLASNLVCNNNITEGSGNSKQSTVAASLATSKSESLSSPLTMPPVCQQQ